jgi:HPr kinase/phosphorylase
MTRTVGLFNPVHPWTVQVLGEAGSAWLEKLPAAPRARLPRELRAAGMTPLIVVAGATLADERRWTAAGIAVEHRAAPAHEIAYALRRQAAAAGRHTVLHGTFLHVHGAGVLLEGPAGAGKSALALELLARGHALVADDAVEFHRPAPSILVGRSPAVLSGYLETRGLGVLDVRRLHGARAVRAHARLDLVVRLARGRPRALTAAERLAGRRGLKRVLGEAVPVLTLPLRHNLAALVEAACLDRRLQLDGLDAPAALEQRQARAIRKQSRGP